MRLKTHSNDKTYVLFNQFKNWLLVDHSEIEYSFGKTNLKKELSMLDIQTLSIFISSKLDQFLKKLIILRLTADSNKRVKVLKAEEEDTESFTQEQM